MDKLFLYLLLSTLISACTKVPELGNGYKFEIVDNVVLSDSLNTILVGEAIVKYWVDSNYILVQQNEITTRKANNVNSINYWIINKNNSRINGPIVQSEFISICNKIGLPENIIWLNIKD